MFYCLNVVEKPITGFLMAGSILTTYPMEFDWQHDLLNRIVVKIKVFKEKWLLTPEIS